MTALFSLGAAMGGALGYVLWILCYIGGSATMLTGLWGLVSRAKRGGYLEGGAWPEFFIVTGAVFLAFPTVLNTGNATLGFSSTASFSGESTPIQFSASDLTQAATQGPAEMISTIFKMFKSYFAAYGALIVWVAIRRQNGLMRGKNHGSTGMNIVMGLAGLGVMNADVIGPAIVSQLGLSS